MRFQDDEPGGTGRMRRAMAVVIVVVAGLVAPSAAQAQESEVVTLLRELVQVNTSNPPGNEARVAELLAPRLRGITTIDKNSLSVTVRTRGTSTHSSRPLPDSAIRRLVRALNRIERFATTPQITPTARRYLRAWADTFGDGDVRRLASTHSDFMRFRLANRVKSGRYGELFNGLVRDIYVPTILDSGFRSNVLPGTAVATVNMRMLPGTHPRPMIRQLRRVIGDRAVTIEPIVTPPSTVEQTLDSFDKRAEQAPSSTDTDLYRSLVRAGRAQWPGVRATPALFEAGTDAVPWRERGIPVYGVYPYPISRSDLMRMHGNDERVPISGLEQGTDWIARVLVDVAAQ